MASEYLEIEEARSDVIYMFAYFIKKRRKELGMTQVYLSELSGVEQDYISKMERGLKPGVTLGIAAKILTALDCPLDFRKLKKR